MPEHDLIITKNKATLLCDRNVVGTIKDTRGLNRNDALRWARDIMDIHGLICEFAEEVNNASRT